jgi:hypothetical protein
MAGEDTVVAIDHSGGARNGALEVVSSDGPDPRFGLSTRPTSGAQYTFVLRCSTWDSRRPT